MPRKKCFEFPLMRLQQPLPVDKPNFVTVVRVIDLIRRSDNGHVLESRSSRSLLDLDSTSWICHRLLYL